MNKNGIRTPHRSEHLAALHAAERRICARLSLAVRRTTDELDLSQSAIAEAAGFVGDQGRIRVNRLLNQIQSLPTAESRAAATKATAHRLRGKQATYRIVATIAELAQRDGVRVEELTMASQPDLLALLDETIAVSQLVRSMLDATAPAWWLETCHHGDLEAAVVLAERLLWGFALQGDMADRLERRWPPTWSGSWETILADDLALADLANQLLVETVDRLEIAGDHPTNGAADGADDDTPPRRAAILSRQVMRGYRNDPTLRVAFETLANRLLAERWTIGLAFSREGDPPPGPEERADYVDLLLSDLNHPGILVPLVDLPLETPDGVYVDRVGHATVVAAGRRDELAVSSTILPRRSPRREEPGDQVTIDLALSALDDKLAEQRLAEDALRLSGNEPGIETVDAELMGGPGQHHQTLDRFDGVSLIAPSEQLARYSTLETVGKLDAGPLYAVSPGPSLSLFPPEVTERQFVAWSAEFPEAVDQALLHELKLTRLMKNQALRRNHRRFVHRHLIPVEGLRDFFLGRPGTNDVFDNPLYGHRYLTSEDRQAVKNKIVRMLGETVAAQQADRGLLLALPTQDEITSLAGLWATITVGDASGVGQVHLVYRSAGDVAANTAVLANLRGLSVEHFRAPNVLIGFLDMLWRRLPTERTDPARVLARVKRMKVA